MDVPKVTALTNSPRAPSTRKHPSSCPPRIGVDESRWHGCVCGRGDQCRRVYERYLKVGHPLAVRLRVPPKLGPLKHRVKRQRMLDRSMVRFSRQRLLCHLGIHEKDLNAVADPRIYGHHFDEEVLQGAGWKPGGQVHWSKPVPGDVVERVSNRPIGAVQYDSANRLRHVGVSGDAIEKEGTISNGPFVVVPNVPLMSPLHSVVLGRYGTISPDSSGGEDNGKGVCRSLSYSGPSSAEPALRPSPRIIRLVIGAVPSMLGTQRATNHSGATIFGPCLPPFAFFGGCLLHQFIPLDKNSINVIDSEGKRLYCLDRLW